MASTLEDFLIGIGVKGQNVVLSEINKVKKEAKALSKLKPVLDMGKGNIAKIMGMIRGGLPIPGGPSAPPGSPEEKKRNNEEKQNNKKFSDKVNSFGRGVKDFTVGVAHFDPVSAVQQAISSTGSAVGALAKAVPVIGDYIQNLPKGIADITNAFVGMGTGALQMAKEAAANQYALSSRNAAVGYYGGNGLNRGGMSNAERADMVFAVSGAYGKIQKPMLDALNELVGTKNSTALSNVASGNWASLGTNKGWMLQQLSNQFSGLPPEIAQQFQTSLLRNYGGEIQGKGIERNAQATNAVFENQREAQTEAIFNRINGKTAESLNKSINNMQLSMFNAGMGMATQIDKAARKVSELVNSFEKMKKTVDTFSFMGRGAPTFVKDMFK